MKIPELAVTESVVMMQRQVRAGFVLHFTSFTSIYFTSLPRCLTRLHRRAAAGAVEPRAAAAVLLAAGIAWGEGLEHGGDVQAVWSELCELFWGELP